MCSFNFKIKTTSCSVVTLACAVCVSGAVKVITVALRSLLSDGPCVTAEITPISGCWPPCCWSRALFVLVPQA